MNRATLLGHISAALTAQRASTALTAQRASTALPADATDTRNNDPLGLNHTPDSTADPVATLILAAIPDGTLDEEDYGVLTHDFSAYDEELGQVIASIDGPHVPHLELLARVTPALARTQRSRDPFSLNGPPEQLGQDGLIETLIVTVTRGALSAQKRGACDPHAAKLALRQARRELALTDTVLRKVQDELRDTLDAQERALQPTPA